MGVKMDDNLNDRTTDTFINSEIENFINYRLFFNLSATDLQKNELKEIVKDTFLQIARFDKKDLISTIANVEFINLKHKEDLYGESGGSTGRSSLKSYIIYFVPHGYSDTVKKLVLAHELAHCFLGHPFKENIHIPDEIRNQREEEAKNKIMEWGFEEGH
jgi:hypothetical protein